MQRIETRLRNVLVVGVKNGRSDRKLQKLCKRVVPCKLIFDGGDDVTR